MGVSETARIVVAERSSIGTARTLARRLAHVAGLGEQRVSEALIVASELATNLVVHAGGGAFLARASPGLLTLCTWDDGPGIADVPRAFGDGYSTSGTAGSGLGAVRRLADAVQVRSSRGAGTVLVADLGERPTRHAGFEADGLAIPLSGEGPCGDAWAVRTDGAALTVLLADGLGHGPEAAEASEAALAVLRDGPDREPVALLEAMHGALRRTRGAAVGVARLEPEQGRVRFTGVGNVAAVWVSPTERKALLSLHGIVGRELRHVTETSHALAPGDAVLLHTDGVREGFEPGAHRGVLLEDPLLAAAAIVRAHERGRDDVGVVLARVAG